MIVQATAADTGFIEEILLDAVGWMEEKGLENWREEDVRWERLSGQFRPEDFYLALEGGRAVGCMALVDHDPLFWPEVEKGKSLYIHKLAVHRSARGRGISGQLIDYGRARCREGGIGSLRLDCRADRPGLRAHYERQGFQLADIRQVLKGFKTARYIYSNLY